MIARWLARRRARRFILSLTLRDLRVLLADQLDRGTPRPAFAALIAYRAAELTDSPEERARFRRYLEAFEQGRRVKRSTFPAITRVEGDPPLELIAEIDRIEREMDDGD